MTFAWPHLLWLLLVPLALFIAELARRRRAAVAAHPKILHAEAGPGGLSLAPRRAAPSRVRPWFCLGLMLAIVAVARPQWGSTEEPVFDQAREILIAIDLSRSMLAQDIKPSRLDRAKLLTQSLLEKLAGERVGLVTFSGTAFLQSPLSSDYEILREFLPALGPDFMPEGGTNYRALIDTSLAAFGRSGSADRFLIVLSDGEATDDNWRDAVPELMKRGIRVIGLGVGTAGGAMIPDGNGGFVKDERGAVVLSKLESGTLQQLAEVTGGTYRDASSWIDLASVLSATIEAGQKGKFLEKNTIRLVERFQWPLAVGLWCLFVSFCYEFPVRPRPRDLKLRGKAEPSPAQPAAVAATAAALLFLGAFGLSPSTRAAETAAPAPPPIAKVVARLAAQDVQSARDWAEMAHETVLWGQRIQSESRQVPPGPINDALAVVEIGAGLDQKAADWPKLREDLTALLKSPDEKKPDQQKQDQKDQQQKNQDQQKDQQNQPKQDQQKQDSSQQKQSKQDPSSQPDESQKDQNQSPDQQQKPEKPDPERKGESAFGDMQQQQPQPTPPPSHDTQKVGGVPEKKQAGVQPTDPSLALPLQKLDQLRNQDSPAELFQLMDTDKKPPTGKPRKNW